MRLLTLCALAAFALAGPARAADDAYDLRGPAPTKGFEYESKSSFVLKDADAAVKVNGQTVAFKQTISSTNTEQVRFLAVDGRKVTKSETRVDKDQTKTVVTVGGEEKEEAKTGDFEGQVVISERAGGDKWKNSLVDATPTDKQKRKLGKMTGPSGDDDMYPAEKVKVGHAWTTPASVLRKKFGDGFTNVEGTLKQEFVRVEAVDGEPCAVVTSAGKLTGQVDADEESDAKHDMVLDLKVTTYRSLKTGLDVKSSFSGTMKVSGKAKANEMELEVTVEGPISGTGSETLVK